MRGSIRNQQLSFHSQVLQIMSSDCHGDGLTLPQPGHQTSQDLPGPKLTRLKYDEVRVWRLELLDKVLLPCLLSNEADDQGGDEKGHDLDDFHHRI